MKPGFIEEFTEEVCEMAVSQDMSDANLQLFFDMLHLEMEDKIQEHEMGVAENEDANMDFLRPEHIKTMMLVKIKAFGTMIRDTKERTIELYHVRKQSASTYQLPKPKNTDEAMQEEEKKDPTQVTVQVNFDTVKKSGETKLAAVDTTQAQTRIEFSQPPQIQAQPSSELESAVEESGVEQAAILIPDVDVDMTDE